MNTNIKTPPYRRSIGEFLCIHPSEPPIENVDWPSSLDIKQDAALRAVIGLRRLGKRVTMDAVASFDAEPKLVAMTYRWARQDAIRRQLGRAQTHPVTVREMSETLVDASQEALCEEIESDFAGELRRLSEQGIDGLTRAQTVRVLMTMRQIQALKEAGTSPLPVALRKQVSRLRQETRLPLDVRLL